VRWSAPGPQAPDEFLARLRTEGERRYHDRHPFHVRMHAGRLDRAELRRWVANRWYYQTRIPVKDALILAKSEDPAFRRVWVRRVIDQDGTADGDGGLAQWLRLAEGVGLSPAALVAGEHVLPGVRFACDAYVDLVRQATLVEAVAASLTEWFAPRLLADRTLAWERHYPWVPADALGYFRSRVPRARRDADDAVAFVVRHADTSEAQDRCVAALVRKTEILWHLLDCVAAGDTAE
jgi:pyrroloquinoline-quinone synthase